MTFFLGVVRERRRFLHLEVVDLLPTFASMIGGTLPSDRAIGGVDRTDALLRKSAAGQGDSLSRRSRPSTTTRHRCRR
jgi:hypothetical protein